MVGGTGDGVVTAPELGRFADPKRILGVLATREFLRAVTFLMTAGLLGGSSGGSDTLRPLISTVAVVSILAA